MSDPVCGAVAYEDYCFSAECGLPPEHPGDHHAVVTWPRPEGTVPSAPREPTELDRMMQRIWASEIKRQLTPLERPS